MSKPNIGRNTREWEYLIHVQLIYPEKDFAKKGFLSPNEVMEHFNHFEVTLMRKGKNLSVYLLLLGQCMVKFISLLESHVIFATTTLFFSRKDKTSISPSDKRTNLDCVA